MGVYKDVAIQSYVEEIGYSLAAVSHRPELDWHFTVLDSPAVNAFALPGGYIYLTRGILSYLVDESQLAGVLGHEVAHVTARHSVQAMTRAQGAQFGLVLGQIFVPPMRGSLGNLAGTGFGLLFLKFGRDDEIQADRLGSEYSFLSGWHPQGVADMLMTLGRISESSDSRGVPNWLSTHPDQASRVAETSSIIRQLLQTVNSQLLRVKQSEYLNQIQGLQFGDRPEDGIVRGNYFLHQSRRFTVTFPQGWKVQNSDSMVLATQSGQENHMILQLVEDSRGSLRAVALESMDQAGYRHRSGNWTTINGLEAYLGIYEGRVDGLGEVLGTVAHIQHEKNIYLFGGIATVDSISLFDRDVRSSIRSFRSLSSEEAGSILPNKIMLYVAREGDTWQQLAKQGGYDMVQSETLAIMNGSPFNKQPKPGDRLKIVVPGEIK
jgi:predicted Zn-dependent protease